MKLYKLSHKGREREPIFIYAREPNHIIELVEYYRERARKAGVIDSPNLGKWVSRVPTVDDIVKIEQARVNYHVGMIVLGGRDVDPDQDFFSEYLQVTDDFLVAVSQEAVVHFAQHRIVLPTLKRGELYKLEVDNSAFGSLNFIPQDVMQGILDYDLTPHLDGSMKLEKRIAEVKRGHPNLM